MIRNIIGKVAISGLLVVVFAKAATSFTRSPLQPEVMRQSNSETLLVAAATDKKEDDAPMIASEEFSDDVLLGRGESFPVCETPEQVLQSLTEERALIALNKVKLADREAEIALAREKLDIEKAALEELKSSIEGLLSVVEAQQTEDLDRLISLYNNMKPAEAATIMNDLDIEVMIMVLGSMSPRTAAPILAKMSPVRARAVSKIILERSKLPGDQKLNGIRFN